MKPAERIAAGPAGTDRRVALVSGGSGGIGAALAACFARDGIDLVLVSRSLSRLEAVAAPLRGLDVNVATIDEDLSVDGAPQRVVERVRAQGLRIDYLVNNAGVGLFGHFATLPVDAQLAMLRLNVLAPTALTRMFLPDLVARRGRVLNVASLASFQPGPYMAAYYGSKAYLLWLSEAVAWELRRSGVTVTAFCPGPTQTGFVGTAGMERSGLVKGKRLDDAAKVAEGAYRAMHAGKAVYVPGIANRLLTLASRLAPRRWTVAAVSAMSAPR